MNKYLRRDAFEGFDELIHTETEELKRTLNTNSESIDAISKLANRHDDQLHALEAVTVKSEQFATWQDQISARLSDSLANTVNSEQLKEWQKRMSEDVTTSQANVDGRIDSLKSTIGSLSEQLSQTEANTAKIKDWQNQIAMFSEDNRKTKEQLSAVDDKIKRVDETVSQATVSKEQLQQWKKELSDEAKSAQVANISKVKDELTGMRNEVDGIKQTNKEFSDKLEMVKRDVESFKQEIKDEITKLREAGVPKEVTQGIKDEIARLVKDVKVSPLSDEEITKRISAATRSLGQLEAQLMNDITLRLMKGLMIRQYYNPRTKATSWLFNWLP
jgi:chromosome segregation ATPase